VTKQLVMVRHRYDKSNLAVIPRLDIVSNVFDLNLMVPERASPWEGRESSRASCKFTSSVGRPLHSIKMSQATLLFESGPPRILCNFMITVRHSMLRQLFKGCYRIQQATEIPLSS
jgi:hypothetical protein